MEYAIAVIDIGMTNKKVAVFDDSLRQIDMVSRTFPPLMVSHGGGDLETHDLGSMKEWFFAELKQFASRYPVRAVSVTTHGATFVCLDKDGQVCAPCVFYTYEPGEAFHRQFYALAGDRDRLQETTFTPPFSSLINPAKGIFFLQKHFPENFSRVATLLNYPQYWGFVLTGVTGIEPTYMGCHTYLWNHEEGTYSPVPEALGIRKLLPENYRNSYETLGSLTGEALALTGLPKDTIVTMGIHDSNASLLPYLARDDGGDFILNSTGTWCVLMHPQDKFNFNPGDIGNIVFFNQSALRKPVKTSIFCGGMEFDTWMGLYKQYNPQAEGPSYDPEVFAALFRENDSYLLPELVPGSGQFNKSQSGILEKGKFYPIEEIRKGNIPPAMREGKKFFALLTASLVIQTVVASRRAGRREGTRIFTEGGFRKDRAYNQLLAAMLPENRVYLTNMNEATSTGAAMTAVMAYTGKSHNDIADTLSIEYSAVEAAAFPNHTHYTEKWLAAANHDTRSII
ncbi:MAG: carbohydrate kinase [Treponema sp.]|jgi:sugar (pentulose or hexulose) kinase|nr:carbohydrate kinase [Treponema sp.]